MSTSKGGPPVELKFELREQPQAGQPLHVDIALITDVATVSRVYAKFVGGDGLELVDGAELEPVEKPPQNSAVRHVVQVLPKQEGLYALTAVVSVDMADDSITRAYSIPVIVGAGVAAQTAKAEVAQGAAAGGVKAR